MIGNITAAEPQKKHANRVSISVDGAYLGSVEDIVWVQSRLKVGNELTEDAWLAMQGRQEEQVILNRALDRLAARARGTQELRRFLLDKGHDGQAVDRVLEKLTEMGYLDDTAFAGMLVRDRVNLKGAGRRAIADELRRVGVGDEAAQQALQEYDPDAEMEAARSHGQKALRLAARQEDPRKRRAKVYASLARKGFGSDIIQRVLRELLEGEPEDTTG